MNKKETLSKFLNNDSNKICKCADLIYSTLVGGVKKHNDPKHALSYIMDTILYSGYNPMPLIQAIAEE